MARYNGEGGRFEIISFLIPWLDEEELNNIYEGYAVEYAEDDDLCLHMSFDTLEEANTAFYTEKAEGFTLPFCWSEKGEDEENGLWARENVICDAETNVIIAVSHYKPEGLDI